MERFYGEIHQQTEAVLKNPSTVAHSRFSTCGLILMINPSVCFVVVVVLSIYQVMWTISSAIQSFMLGVFSGLHNLHSYPALVTFSVSVWFENETQKISSVLTSSEAWMQCTRNTAALSFWKCTEEAKILLQTILSYARYNLNHPFIYLNYFLSICFCRYSPSKCRANFSSTTAVQRPQVCSIWQYLPKWWREEQTEQQASSFLMP